MSKISVVITCFNSQQYIKEALFSVFDQTYRNIEIIVVDDGSTDSTQKVLAPYMDKIQYIYQKNAGPSAARNVGIKSAKGQFVAFLDADDRWIENKLEEQLECIASSDKVGLVACGRIIENNTKQTVGIYQPNLLNFNRAELLRLMLYRNVIGGASTVLVRKACFDVVGLFDEQLHVSEDRDMWFRICQRYEYAEVNKPLIVYRLMPGSQSSNSTKNLSNQMKFLNNIFDNSDSWSSSLKKEVLSEHLMCASWTALTNNNVVEARKLIFAAFKKSPKYSLLNITYLKLFTRIMLGNNFTKLFLRKKGTC